MKVKRKKINTECPICNEEMVKCRVQGTVYSLTVVQEPIRDFTHKKGSPITAYVCSSCGYINFYANKPNIFKPTNKKE